LPLSRFQLELGPELVEALFREREEDETEHGPRYSAAVKLEPWDCSRTKNLP
jgi:hypothetical protein